MKIEQTDFHQISVSETLEQLKTDLNGLSEKAVDNRLQQFGPNQLPTTKPPSIFSIFVDQLNSSIVYLLLAAAATSFFFSDFTEGVAILMVILVNAVIGFIMEFQAIRSMQALKKLDLVEAKVYRNGSLSSINARQLVPGDLIFVEGGDIIPADARLVHTVDLECDESALTGESLPVLKNTQQLPVDTEIADRVNMLFKGAAITKGNAKAVITATAGRTELGKIAKLVSTAQQEDTPLNKKLDGFSKKLIWLVVAIAFPFLVVGIWQQRDMHLMIETAIALAVAAIPEGLPIVATIALARGMLSLAKKQVLIKKLAAVETLGSANIVLTDKTGTLTENKLTVHQLLFETGMQVELSWLEHGRKLQLSGDHLGDYRDGTSGEVINKLVEIGVLCNNASFNHDDQKEVGDPLEISLHKFAAAYDRDWYLGLIGQEKIDEIPFDSDSKIMGTLHQMNNGFKVSAKGAVEAILERCSFILKDGIPEPITDQDIAKLLSRSDETAAKGMKVIGFAYQQIKIPEEQFLKDLVFVGMIGFLDPPRADIEEALQECRQAGIKVVMITGDHYETAKEISRQVGLNDLNNELFGIRGKELAALDLSDPASAQRIESAVFLSRVTPVQKLDLVDFYQKKGYVVGMTGDGINDAPALKKADIGIAMGLRGTQVAREASDMILKDDAFSSLVLGIKQGRSIYNNVKNFIIYLLSCNLSEILIVAIAAFSNMVLPLLPLQILFLNLVTDVFPALALGMGKSGPNIMNQPPRGVKEPLITRQNWVSILTYSAVLTASVFTVFIYSLYGLDYSPEQSNTLVFFSLAFAQLVHPLSLVPASVSFFNNTIIKNIHIWLAVAFCVVLILLVYIVPFSQKVLSLSVLPSSDWHLIALASISPVIVIRVLKKIEIIQ